MTNYILGPDGRTPEPVDDIRAWGRWFETADRQIADDYVGDTRVSTVFLGLDHSFGRGGPPLVFETMIFGGGLSDREWRYATYEEAEAGHREALALAHTYNDLKIEERT